MKYILTIAITLLLINFAQSQNYKRIKIYLNDRSEILQLRKAGLEFDHFIWGKDKSIDCFISDDEFLKLQSTSFRFEVIIEDWVKYYENLPKLSDDEKANVLSKSAIIYNVTGLDYGSMGGYYTLAEVYDRLDKMYDLYPNIITKKYSIGQTIEGRPIYTVKISDNPDLDEDEPQVFYNALIHAREPAAMMTVMYYMFYLLENYDIDKEITYLVNNREIYFIPVVNPDGYEYNRLTNPSGGGMWRKNRRDNGDGTYGVDLNRNFGYEWGYDNSGSSPVPGSETYRGIGPFSEPETQAIRDYCNLKKIRTTLNYHTYSNLLLYPWGYIEDPTPDNNIFAEYSADMTQFNNYTAGQSPIVLYTVNGSTDDWMYGEQSTKPKTFAMTPEVGSSSDGFWPPQSRIFPLAEENLFPNLYYTWVAGAYVGLTHPGYSKEYFKPGDIIFMNCIFRNKGLSDGENFNVKLTSLSPYLEINEGTTTFDFIAARDTASLQTPFSFTVSPSAINGAEAKLVVTTIFDDVVMSSDTLRLIIGVPNYFFKDSTNNPADLWTITRSPNNSPKWEATTETFYSEPVSYTDSKDGNYINDATVTMTLTNPIDISDLTNPKLAFWTKYNIENDWDYGQVKVSTNNGISWIPLAGNYTNPAAGSFQPFGQPVYDGFRPNWVREEILIDDYKSTQFKIRFELKSDEAVTLDGWYLDDIAIIFYDTVSTSVEENKISVVREYSLEQNYPNPFNPSSVINYAIPQSGKVTIKVYNILGLEVATLVNENKSAGRHQIKFNAEGLSSGIYFYTLSAGNYSQTRKMIILR